MTIPKGSEYSFNVTVIEKDSFLPQDLTNIDIPNCEFKLVHLGTLCDVTEGTTTITVLNALNGVMEVTLDAAKTGALEYERGDKVDNYYLKALYQGIVIVKFTDGTSSRVAVVPEIKVAPIGVACA